MKKFFKRVLSAVVTTVVLASSSIVFTSAPAMAAGITVSAAGWKEDAYAEWLPVSGASSYKAYVKKSGDSSYTELDDELIRQYDTYVRADAVGIAKGNYKMKIVALDASGKEIASQETGDIAVDEFNRSGFAFSGDSYEKGNGMGGYNADGTPKSDAVIVYITDENKNTVQCDVVTDKKGTKTTGTGLGEIIKLFEKGYETRPFIFRFVGEIAPPYSEDKFTLKVTDEEFHNGNNSSYRILDIKYNMKNISSGGGITFEGIGNDTVLHFNFNLTGAKDIEVRNFGFKDMTTKDEDAVTVTSNSSNYWVHNNDFFYGGQGSDKDQAKGDGCVDIKKAPDYGTISENHFWDTGKSSLCGLGESADYHVSYIANWFDHSDSRHPRIRGGSIYIANNYFDGNAKYGVGMTSGGSAFVENNYFRDTKRPMMISGQGTDANGTGTFSGENGGIIKVFNNIYSGKYELIEGISKDAEGNKVYDSYADGYTVDSRSETLPSTCVAYKGGSSYNNFDTTIDLGVKEADILAPTEVPSYVMSNAGRCDGGNFTFTFDDAVDDTDYAVNDKLVTALAAYRNSIVTIGGTVTKSGNTSATASSATGVDGNKAYTTKFNAYAVKAASLPTVSDAPNSGTTSTANYAILVRNTDLSGKELTSTTTVNGSVGEISIIADSSNKVTLDSSKGIQLNGAGNTTKRAIVVKMTEKGTLYVKGASTKSGETRTLEVSDGTKAVGTTETETTGTFDLDAGTYYIYSKSKGINVSFLGVIYDSAKEDTGDDDKDNDDDNNNDQPTVTVVYGDANGDGKVTAEDAALVLQKALDSDYVLSIDDYMSVINVDGNTELDSNDAAMILQKALNDDFVLPVESK